MPESPDHNVFEIRPEILKQYVKSGLNYKKYVYVSYSFICSKTALCDHCKRRFNFRLPLQKMF